ncbi:16S rRNA (uracil(1498)-N(3))-methyltransferase [Candidatus Giovannonibacteria bacterium]|nr:16S rRNA (uracil(1498)-N(3))-methyltransferase [Candidatus Giovannonibacteria bacterium]
MNRFFLNDTLNKDVIVIKDRALIHQMKNVLKLHKGERVGFFNEEPQFVGFDFVSELKNLDPGMAIFMVREKIENTRESSRKLVLYQSLIKKDNFEWVLEKATEVGVSEIVPVLSARSEKKTLNSVRCQLILKEAAEQAGRAFIPKMRGVLIFEKAIMEAQSSGRKTYFAYEEESHNMIHGVGERSMNLFIGPEGGWEEREILAIHRVGFEIISLGRLTLRAETAAISAAYTLLWV